MTKRLVLGVALVFVAVGNSLAQTMPQVPALPIDTAVKVGKLDNG